MLLEVDVVPHRRPRGEDDVGVEHDLRLHLVEDVEEPFAPLHELDHLRILRPRRVAVDRVLQQIRGHARSVGRNESALLLQQPAGLLGDELGVVETHDTQLQAPLDMGVVVNVCRDIGIPVFAGLDRRLDLGGGELQGVQRVFFGGNAATNHDLDVVSSEGEVFPGLLEHFRRTICKA